MFPLGKSKLGMWGWSFLPSWDAAFNRRHCHSSLVPVACSFEEKTTELWKCPWKYMKNGSLGGSPWKEKPDCFHSPQESSKSELMKWNKWIMRKVASYDFIHVWNIKLLQNIVISNFTPQTRVVDITTALHVTPATGYILISLLFLHNFGKHITSFIVQAHTHKGTTWKK